MCDYLYIAFAPVRLPKYRREHLKKQAASELGVTEFT